MTNNNLKEIIAMSARPVKADRAKLAPVPGQPSVELPSFLRQTKRSQAIHAGKAAS